MRSFPPMFRAGALLALWSGVTAVQAQAPDGCRGAADCAETPKFVARVTDFRVSAGEQGARVASATIRFQNRTERSLVLGYVGESGLATDDKGNRFGGAGGSVRGIGLVTGTAHDGKFALGPGESGDARFEFVWRPENDGTPAGRAFVLELAVREIDAVNETQTRLGREHALAFRGLSGVAAAAEPVDPCAEKPRCVNAGPFAAEVVNITESKQGVYNDHVLTFTVRFRNIGEQPLAFRRGIHDAHCRGRV